MRRPLLCVIVTTLAACGDLPHDNPRDPQAPSDVQGRATLTGEVALEPVGGTTPPLSAIHVSVAGHGWSADTDAEGRFSITGVPVGTWAVQYTRPGWDDEVISGVVITLDEAGEEIPLAPVRLKVSRGNVAGRILLEQEDTAGGVAVSLEGFEGATFTNGEGRFALSGIPVGTYALQASKPGFLPGQVTSVEVTAAGVTLLGDLLLYVNPGGFEGQVLVSGAGDSGSVLVRARGTTLNGTPWETSAPTTADGRYILSGVPGGTYNVSYEFDGYAVQSTAAAVVPGEITLLAPVTLAREMSAVAGIARLEGGTDHSGIQVALRPDLSSPPVALAITDAAGAWRMDVAPIGTWELTYERPGYVATNGSVTLVAGELAVAADVTLSAIPGILRGQILLEGVAGDLGGTTVTLDGAVFQTDASGAWRSENVAAGLHTLVYQRTGFEPQRRQVTTAAGGDLDLGPVTLSVARGTIEGAVALSPGDVAGFPVATDLSGIRVSLTGTGVPVNAVLTNSRGEYRFENVPVSRSGAAYDVGAQLTGYLQAAPVSVVAQGATTVPAPALTLQVHGGALSGRARFWDSRGAYASSSGITVTVTGTAFSGVAWSGAATTDQSGAFTAANLPPGTYDVVAESANYDCGLFSRGVVVGGTTSSVASEFQCRDTVPPAGLVLGQPSRPDGAQLGYTNQRAVVVPIAAQASDGTNNLEGYQTVIGSAPSWTSATVVQGAPASVSFSLQPAAGQSDNQRFVLWVRPIDWAGNAGPPASVEVVLDEVAPSAPTISTPRTLVNATTTSVTLYGSQDPNLAGYLACTALRPVDGSAAPACDLAPTSAVFPVSLTANRTTTIRARAIDKAGNLSVESAATPESALDVTSDMTAPTAPQLAPRYDPDQLTVRAPSVDFHVASAAVDPPRTIAWQGLAHLEVDTGNGFEPLCPGCHQESGAGPIWSPCSCQCPDPRRLCNGTQFVGVRVPLSTSFTTVALRAVDLAGNVGASTSQQVRAQPTSDLLTGTTGPVTIRLRGNQIGYSGGEMGVIDLGPNRRYSRTNGDEWCRLHGAVNRGYDAIPLSERYVAYAPGFDNGQGEIIIRQRSPATGLLCPAEDPSYIVYTIIPDPPGSYFATGLAGDIRRLAYIERYETHDEIVIRGSWSPSEPVGSDFDAVTRIIPSLSLPRIDRLELQGDTLLASATINWLVLGAGADGTFADGVRREEVQFLADDAALSRDGSLIAYRVGTSVSVWQAGPDAVWGTADDRFVELLPPEGQEATGQLAVDGGRVVLVRTETNDMLYWTWGSDESWGPEEARASVVDLRIDRPLRPDLEASLLAVTGTDGGIELRDLSVLRWETPLLGGIASRTDGLISPDTGALLWLPGDGTQMIRYPDEVEVRIEAPQAPRLQAAAGRNLLSVSDQAVTLFQPDGDGRYHPDGAGVTLLPDVTGIDAIIGRADKALLHQRRGSIPIVRVLQSTSVDGLVDFPTAGSDYTFLIPSAPEAKALAITSRQVFFSAANWIATYWTEDGSFGPEDEANLKALTFAIRFQPSPGTILAANDDLMVLSDPEYGTAVIDPGPDHIYGMWAGDQGWSFSNDLIAWVPLPRTYNGQAAVRFPDQVAVNGRWAAWVLPDESWNEQVFVQHGSEGLPIQITSHPSEKRNLTLSTTGAVHWTDSIVSPPVIMSYSP